MNARLKADLCLLLTALIWGGGFVAQKTPMAFVGPIAYNAMRFGLSSLVMVPFVLRYSSGSPTRTEIRSGVLLGTLLFIGSVLQQIGVSQTTAGKAGFITGLYVILIPIFLGLIWHERVQRVVWLGALLGVAGLYLLCIREGLSLSIGDAWVLACAVTFSVHVILTGKYVTGGEVLFIAAFQAGVCAVLSAVTGFYLEETKLSNIQFYWPELLYSGVLASGLGFYLQASSQKITPTSHAAIILGLETVFGALAGWYFLGELLTPKQLFGCSLIFSGIVVSQLSVLRGDSSSGTCGNTTGS